MKKYTDYNKDVFKIDFKKVDFTKYKIIVPTEKDRDELLEAFEYFHDSDFDTDYITVNQLAHEYLTEEREPGSKNNIIVDKGLYDKLVK